MLAQRPASADGDQASAGRPAKGAGEVLPIRVEVGGYSSHVDRGFGTWSGADGQVWVRSSTVFIPMFSVASQSRPEGSQQAFSFFSYMNWSKSFYTTQGFSFAPQSAGRPLLFPKYRYDVKAHYKLPPARNFLLTAGYTRFDFGGPIHGEMYGAGFLYYRHKWVVEGNGYLTRNQPGDLISGAGDLAVQYGREGRYWAGTRFGGGREVYRYIVMTPLEVRLNSVSNYTFFRKWINRNVGFVLFAEFQNRMSAYRRIGGGGRLFFEF